MTYTIHSALATLLTLTMLGFSGNTAAIVIDLILTCDDAAMTCSYEGETTFSGSVAVVEGIFEDMQHVETKADAMLGNRIEFTPSANSIVVRNGVVFLSNEFGESVQFVTFFNIPPSMPSPGDFTSSFIGSPGPFSPAPLPTGLLFHGIHWPFSYEGAGTLRLSGELENVQAGVSGETVPEPTTLTLIGLGLVGLGFTRKCRLQT